MDKHKIVLHQPEWGYTEQSKYLFLSDLLPRVVPKISYFQRRCISLWKNVEIGYSDFFEYFPSLSFWQKLLTEFDLWTASGLCIPCSSVTFFSWKSWVSTFFLQKSPWSALHIASIFPQSCCSFSNRRTPILPRQLLLALTQDEMGQQRNRVAQLSFLHNGKEIPSVLNTGFGKREEVLSGPRHIRGHLTCTMLESTGCSKQSWSSDGQVTCVFLWAPKGSHCFSINFWDSYWEDSGYTRKMLSSEL